MALGLATFLGAWQVLTIRPQSVSILLFVGLFDVLLRAEKDWRWLAVTPWFLALWANVHGAFPAGLMLIGMFTGARILRLLPFGPLSPGTPGERAGVRGSVRPAAMSGCASRADAAPSPPTPLPRSTGGEGSRVVALVIGVRGVCGGNAGQSVWLGDLLVRGPHVGRFGPARHRRMVAAELGSGDRRGVVCVAADRDWGVGWSWKKGRRVSWREAFLLVCFGFLAARSIRMVIWWLIVIAPMIAVRLADFWPRSRAIMYVPSRAAGFTVAGLLAMCVLSLPPLHGFNPLLMVRTPNETTANLEKAYQLIASRAKSGKIFTKLEWGEYLGWRGYPNWKVNIDGRIEIYPDKVWSRYHG